MWWFKKGEACLLSPRSGFVQQSHAHGRQFRCALFPPVMAGVSDLKRTRCLYEAREIA
jgi:hypothetical protein